MNYSHRSLISDDVDAGLTSAPESQNEHGENSSQTQSFDSSDEDEYEELRNIESKRKK